MDSVMLDVMIEQSLTDAARKIAAYCKSVEDCADCPFDKNRSCVLFDELPCDWNLDEGGGENAKDAH